MKEPKNAGVSGAYQLFMLVLCMYALGTLAAERTIQMQPAAREILNYADYVVCGLFLIDFFHSVYRAENRWRYFIKWGWLDLLSSIPMLDITRWGRVARVIRVFKVIRGLRLSKLVATAMVQRRRENAFLAASLLGLMLLVFGSIAILNIETTADSNIKTSEDAIWWAFTSIMTVGYGDHYPVTSEGRVLAGILMCSGVGLFGTFAGFLASWFIGSEEAEHGAVATELKALREELAAVRRAVGDGRRPQDHEVSGAKTA
jgi:voltage-gated potassium channel